MATITPIGTSPRVERGEVIEKVIDGKVMRYVDIDALGPAERGKWARGKIPECVVIDRADLFRPARSVRPD